MDAYSIWNECQCNDKIIFIPEGTSIVTFDKDAELVSRVLSRKMIGNKVEIIEDTVHLALSELCSLGYKVREVIYCNL